MSQIDKLVKLSVWYAWVIIYVALLSILVMVVTNTLPWEFFLIGKVIIMLIATVVATIMVVDE